jgi:hypothetical protein
MPQRIMGSGRGQGGRQHEGGEGQAAAAFTTAHHEPRILTCMRQAPGVQTGLQGSPLYTHEGALPA